ncbi:outer membrane protein assembly factor BamB family protein [Caldithrix abyssi]
MKKFLIVLVVFLFSCQSSSKRIAWLSDTHVSLTTGGTQDLIAVVKDINRQKNIHLVIISGDITEINTGSNLQTAKHILDRLQMPYYIIPGNHDTKWSDSGLQGFRKLFGNDKFQFDLMGIQFIGLHQGPVLRMADGHFSPQDLNWLQNVLSHLRHPRQPVVIITHYPLYPPFAVDNYFRFLQIIRNYNVKMVLHGHGHRNRRVNAYGIPQIMGRSTLSRGKNAAYNIIELDRKEFRFYAKTVGENRPSLWTKVDMETDYVVADSLIELPDYSVNVQYPAVKEIWKRSFNALITASPAADERAVFIGDHMGRLHCLDLASGEEIWTQKFSGALYSKPAVSNRRIIFTCVDSSVYCLDTQNGERIWRFRTGAPMYAAPVVSGDTVFVGGNDGAFYALDLNSGRCIWQFNGINGYIETRPLLTKDKVVFGAWDDYLYALKKRDGRPVWKWRGPAENALFSPAACWPVAVKNQLFVVAPDRFLTAIDLTNGLTLWRSNRYKVRETIGADEHFVLAKCMRDTVFSLRPSEKGPRYNWVKNMDFGYDIANSMIQVKGQTAFFGTKNGLVVAFNIHDGKVIWKHKTGNSFIPTVLPLSSSSLIVSSMDGIVARLQYSNH